MIFETHLRRFTMGHNLHAQLQSYYNRQNSAIRIGQPEQLLGGYDTDIFRFTLTDESGSHSRVLRRYPPDQGHKKAVYEAITQNHISEQAFPVPRVFNVCTDKSIVGGAFIVMEFAEGRRLLDAPESVQSVVLGQTHARLHNLDSDQLRSALWQIGDRFTFDWRIEKLAEASERHPVIQGALDWVRRNQPMDSSELSICHGDFHKLNVLCDDSNEVSAVLDWSAVGVMEPEFDVAQTVLIFAKQAKHLTKFAPVDYEQIVSEYLYGYRQVRELDEEKLRYYSVVRSLMGIVLGLEGNKLWPPGLVDELMQDVFKQIESA